MNTMTFADAGRTLFALWLLFWLAWAIAKISEVFVLWKRRKAIDRIIAEQQREREHELRLWVQDW